MANPYPYAAPPAAALYANWGQRAGAWLIDNLPAAIVLIIFYQINTAVYIVGIIAALGWAIYNRWYMGGTTGQSVGKKVLNIRLVSDDSGQPIGMLMAFVRDICHIVDNIICYIGYLFPLWTAKRQTIADMIVRSVVVPAGVPVPEAPGPAGY